MRTNPHPQLSRTGWRHALVSGRTYGVVALTVLAVGSMTACDGGGDASVTPTTSPTTSTTESPTAGASIEWEACTEVDLASGQCASLEVPIDYDDPTGASIDIFVFRTPARGTRLGTLIVNPGGPGASAVDFVRDRFGSFPPGFDVVAFDPRGVGRSHPVHCLESSDIDTMFTEPLRPADDAELADWLAEAKQTADTCLATDIGSHLGTVNVARDLDRLRLALGEEKISYLGFSYGARLGWTYASMFPDHVRAMVLDGPEDPVADIAAGIVRQAVEFERLATEFNDTCEDTPSTPCPDDIRAAASQIVERAEKTPIPTRAGQPALSASYAVNAVLSAFYNSDAWPDLSEALWLANANDGLPLAQLSYWWIQNHGPNPDATLDPIDLIWCADHTDRPTVDDYVTIAEQVAEVSPTFAAWYPGPVPRCYGYPPAAEPTPEPTNRSAVPILVVASTGDFATPLAGAQRLVSMLGRAVLLTREGPGHTSIGLGYECVDQHVDRFLADAELPAANTTCT